jgi:integration host factor subunit alpha
MALTKNVIVEQIQGSLGFPKNQSVDITESLLELIKSSLASGDDVLVSGFGKFCVKERRERKGRNPATGEDAILSARRVVTFKCSGKLRERLNG